MISKILRLIKKKKKNVQELYSCTVFQEEAKLMQMFLKANNQKFGYRL